VDLQGIVVHEQLLVEFEGPFGQSGGRLVYGISTVTCFVTKNCGQFLCVTIIC